MAKKVVTKAQVLKQGKELFGSIQKFNLWLNTENVAMGNIKPITIWDTKKGLQLISDEIIRTGQGIF